MLSRTEVQKLQAALLGWYERNARDLPWRRTSDPYAILLAEVLLQQTRVEQATGYYARFLEAFPDLRALAAAPEEAVMRVWAGAGYYRRARNLHRLAQQVGAEGLPRRASDLAALPGIGPYTAAAVASIAFGEPTAVVDGNVRRVLARLFAQRNPKPRWLRETAAALLAQTEPGRWNQALMELGATACTPRNPGCGVCPLAPFCAGKESPGQYPEPRRRSQKKVQAAALVLRGRGGYVLERRDGPSLGGLWGFPLAEGRGALGTLLSRYGVPSARRIGTVRHAFTHKELSIAVYAADWTGPAQDPASLPLSVLDRKVLRLAEAQGPSDPGARATKR